MEKRSSEVLFQRPSLASTGSTGSPADSSAPHPASPPAHPRSGWGTGIAAPPVDLDTQRSLGSGLAPDPCPQPAGPSSLPPSAPLVCDPQASQGSDESHEESDIRQLWTTTVLSQMHLSLPLPKVSEWSESDSSSFCHQKSSVKLGAAEWEWDKEEHVSPPSDQGFKPELDEHTLLKLHRAHSLENDLEEGDSRTEPEKSASTSSLSILKHMPHRAYWEEQHNRLPLPLTELMENEAVEILTKALQSYLSGIGRDHFLTKQLQRRIEKLKKRRNKRLQVSLR